VYPADVCFIIDAFELSLVDVGFFLVAVNSFLTFLVGINPAASGLKALVLLFPVPSDKQVNSTSYRPSA
jgi:hypothetical protein